MTVMKSADLREGKVLTGYRRDSPLERLEIIFKKWSKLAIKSIFLPDYTGFVGLWQSRPVSFWMNPKKHFFRWETCYLKDSQASFIPRFAWKTHNENIW